MSEQPVTIVAFEFENVKAVHAVRYEIRDESLVIIGGSNGSGKTTILDSIAYTVGGAKYRPSNVRNDETDEDPYFHVVLSNGIVAERKNKNSDLVVFDPEGKKAGQALLNEFIPEFALNIQPFMSANSKDKTKMLLRIAGVEDELNHLKALEQSAYDDRRACNAQLDSLRKQLAGMTYNDDQPEELVSAQAIIAEIQEANRTNRKNEEVRQQLADATKSVNTQVARESEIVEQIKQLQEELAGVRKYKDDLKVKAMNLTQQVEDLEDVDTNTLSAKLETIEETNERIRENRQYVEKKAELAKKATEYKKLDLSVEKYRRQQLELLSDAPELPMEGLSIIDDEIAYNDQKWDCMSGSDQLRVAVACVSRINPKCGFVLVDKLEQMDPTTRKEFGEWLRSKGLVAITTMVCDDNNSECSIILREGRQVENPAKPVASEKTKPKAQEEPTQGNLFM